MTTLYEIKKKTLVLIEEANPESEYLTDDPDIAAKFNDVANMVMFELARIKEIPRYVEVEVKEGDIINFEMLEKVCGSEVYQISLVSGVKCKQRAKGTVYKVLEDGIAEIDLFIYPEKITEKTNAKGYEFELSPDVIEIMPYGIAGDLLKSDVSAEYGTIYSKEYIAKLERLDPRYSMPSICIEGGVDI